MRSILFAAILLLVAGLLCVAADAVDQYGVFEAEFTTEKAYSNPYTELDAVAVVTLPSALSWSVPLFWDGGNTWKLRVSPHLAGRWTYEVISSDPGLDKQTGFFECRHSEARGSIVPMEGHPRHFQYQDGTPVWFMGDTAWALFTDIEEENHYRENAEQYVLARSRQGFNAVHSMMMSEQGGGNEAGLPFDDIAQEKINPGYWREVDDRLSYANGSGLVVGLALAWGDKRKVEPFAWSRFPNVEARKRYARYIGARYGAYNVYFLVSGEWHAEANNREGATQESIFQEFVEIGDALAETNVHGRMIGIHPMTRKGSVREFAMASWMSFADYQQNYSDLHARALASAAIGGPVVNSEYGYLLRDSDGDGHPDKSNSFSVDDMRHASWDIVMAGGYLVTGFGSTYFGGHRDPGRFDVDAEKNIPWEEQIGHIKKLFEEVEWWKLTSADGLISAGTPRGEDRTVKFPRGDGQGAGIAPPAATYWAMTIPGEAYLIYTRGLAEPGKLELDARAGAFHARQFNPRTGEFRDLGRQEINANYSYTPPDREDWAVLLERAQ